MRPTPNSLSQYHVFLASPGDVGAERQFVRRFFDEYNRHTAHIWRARFEVVDWENYATIGIGRPQELITQQTLEKYRKSLALVIGIMGQRFGSPTGKAESGTEEEFNWAMESYRASGFPEIKWFFRKVDKLDGLPADPADATKALDQWQRVLAFRKQMQDLNDPVFYAEYPSSAGFAEVFEHDLNRWLADSARPWAAETAVQVATTGSATTVALPAEFDAEQYRAAVLKRYERLNFEMLDTTGAFYNSVRLWSVFVPQSVRECRQYNPRLLEIPKEHQQRLLDTGEITAKELEEAERHAERLRQEYFHQPLSAVLDVVDKTLRASATGAGGKLVILGDPGSGKSSLVRYLALRWAGIAELPIRDTHPIPLVIELGPYSRWQCDGRKDFVRYLEEAPVWHEWPRGLLGRLIEQPGRVVLLLDGLDEVFDVPARELVINDIQRFSSRFVNVPVVLMSRVVGYQAERLRDAEFRHFMLQDLDSTQITDFVNRWHEVTFDDPTQAAPKRDRLQKAIRESKSIALLAGNPLLLTMMAILNRNQELPRDRADLYAQASRVLLHQWDTERALVDFPGMSSEIGLREKTDILRRIAAHMQSGPSGLKGNLIDGPTLTGLIEDYLQNELHFGQARAAARAVVDQLRQRNFILCFVGADSYAFVHRTFLEYFCATDLVHQFNVAKTLEIDGLIALFEQHCRDDEWREVLRLICGQIDEAFVGRIVERLVTRTDLEKWDGVTQLPELLLAIWSITEVRNSTRLESTGVRVLEKVVDCARKGAQAGGERFLMQELLPACKELGERWPGRQMLIKFEQCNLDGVTDYGWGEDFWPHLMAFVLASRKAVMWLADTKVGANNGAYYRRAALQALAEKWPDQTTGDLLTLRAVQDDDYKTRSAALEVLAQTRPDQTTRHLLTLCAVQDVHFQTRSDALRALAQTWPDQTTRDLFTLRAVQDYHYQTRNAVLRALAQTWPDQTTRDLLTLRAVEDDIDQTRSAALQTLAQIWPDQTTRDLLTLRAVEDDNDRIRSAALQTLAQTWPDRTTRDLLTLRAVEDDNYETRSAALQTLAQTWPDQTTRDLFTLCAVQDDNYQTRRDSLQALAETWPDQTTRDLLALRAVQDSNGEVRGVAFSAVGEMHSEFGRILPTQDLDGIEPYLDPLEPIPRQHLEKAAAKAGINPEDINTQIASLSAYLGWDVTVGAKKRVVKKTGRQTRGRKRHN